MATGGDALDRYRAAAADPANVALEGFHALKHALRFGADVVVAITSCRADLAKLSADLAPDIAETIEQLVVEVSDDELASLVGNPPPTDSLALARRPTFEPAAILAASPSAPIVLLDEPKHLGNIGAVVRVAAAAGADAVLTTGDRDPWHPTALRGSAGLHFALPVARVADPAFGARSVVALDPNGAPLGAGTVPSAAVIAFGSERHGLSPSLLAQADRRLAIPMRPGVSSLNLATAVAIVLYQGRLDPR